MAHTTVLVLERNCRFEPLVHKLSRMKRTVKDMSELMVAIAKYAESDKTKDPASDDEMSWKGKKNGGKSHQNNNNGHNNNSNKQKHAEESSNLVTNTSSSYKSQRQNDSFKRQSQVFRLSNY